MAKEKPGKSAFRFQKYSEVFFPVFVVGCTRFRAAGVVMESTSHISQHHLTWSPQVKLVASRNILKCNLRKRC